MVLTRQIRIGEAQRHHELIQEFMLFTYGSDDFSLELIGSGSQKGVYRLESNTRNFVVAAGLSLNDNHNLLKEYVVLKGMHAAAPNYFPKAIAHYSSQSQNDLGDMIVMAYITMPDIDAYRRTDQSFGKYSRSLAQAIGKHLGEVVLLTGRYSSEPHDGNIFISVENQGTSNPTIDLKFCDAIQYLQGTLEDQAVSLLTYGDHRRECVSFPNYLHKGFMQAIMKVNNTDEKEARKQLEFMKKYSGIIE